ncbi:glycoside hydrolase family 2 TIM barrel-domain containing protein [Microbacterium sp. P01]|uniref:glycoside hydrolase family 2 TIM barrel-domain containing protein n=1 Tax=Microbacterium sp. P01 TaxID=3366261 RepID=UPI00366AF836
MTVTSFTAGWTHRAPTGPFASADREQVPPVVVRLPHDALRDESRRPDVPGRGAGAYYPPIARTYSKTFDVPAGWEGRIVRLEVQGAYRRAQVFVNNEFAGNRADGYARFFVDMTPFLRFGQPNEVRIEVRAGEDSRWYAGAGIHRPVLLHVDEPVHIAPDGVTVTTVRIEHDQAVVDVVTKIANRGLITRTVRVATRISDEHGAQVEGDESPATVPPGDVILVRQRLYIPQPALWSPSSPALHTADVSLAGSDDVTVTFGIRTVTVDPRKGLRINGEAVLLRGACIHSDNGPLGAAAIGRADERRIELLKAAGFNAIRAAHNPASIALLDACDKHGMLVMDEAFDMWTRFKTANDYAADFPQWWAADLASMVTKDRNHPSVIMYSLGNEIVEVGSGHGAGWARRMAEHVRDLDPTRLITNGINTFLAVVDELPSILEAGGGALNEAMANPEEGFNAISVSDAVTTRIEESSATLDVLGLNYADARYAVDREQLPHRIIVGSETMPSAIGRLWPMVIENPHVIGDFTWTGWDYLGEVGIGATAYAEDPDAVPGLEREYPYLTAWCGDLDITGWRRPLSFYREIVFGLRAEPYIAVQRPEHHDHTIAGRAPWGWSDSISSWAWPGYEGRPVTVEVYADADLVALLLDGDEIARAQTGTDRPMIAVLETEYRPGVLEAVAFTDGVETARTTLATPAEGVALSARVDRSVIRDTDADLAYVEIELHDPADRLVTSADRAVTVEVSGAGQLVGMCSANPRTEERFDSSTWRTFDGRALAVVRPTGVGAITVAVSADGLAGLSLHIDVAAQ